MKRILLISCWTFCTAGLIVLLGFVNRKEELQPCYTVDISIDESTGHHFVEPENVRAMLSAAGDPLVGTPLRDINIGLLEKSIRANSYVANAEVYSTVDGTVHIDIVQRNPLIRIINRMNESFYIDENGMFMPLSEQYTARVPVATGYIFQSYGQRCVSPNGIEKDTSHQKTILDNLFSISKFLKENNYWSAQSEQLYVNEEKEIEMIPKVGGHRILLGDASELNAKLSKLFILYQKGLSQKGWHQYQLINLKYKDQVVCTRLDSITSN